MAYCCSNLGECRDITSLIDIPLPYFGFVYIENLNDDAIWFRMTTVLLSKYMYILAIKTIIFVHSH